MRLLTGFMIVTSMTAPWYYLVQKANPEFLHFFFVTQQFSRFLTKGDFNNQTAIWFYVPIVLAGFFPWSIFIMQAIAQQCKVIWKNRQQHTAALFLLLWFILIFIFFSIPKSKTIGYIIPIFPSLALLVGHYLDNTWNAIRAKLTYSLIAIAVIGLLILSASASLLNHKSIKPIALELKPQLTANDEVVTYYKYYQDLPIYLERRITIVADWHAPDIIKKDNWIRELWFGMPFQNTKDWLIDENAFWQRWNSNKRLFVLMDKSDYASFVAKAKIARPLGAYRDVVWVSNQLT
ncbi:MAG: Family 39 glycosyl transferase [uncultured bacterium]|nr:MAG: Family 39 glycosyl transferase [uncultured bacterium]